MHDENTYGLCECGCGRKTNIAKVTDPRSGQIKGEPLRYIKGHHNRKAGPQHEEVDLGYDTPCWLWLMSVRPNGYGRLTDYERTGTTGYAHIIYYERAKGPVPKGMHLDHLCHNASTCPGGDTCPHRRCVNPDHMEPAPTQVNSRRGRSAHLTPEQVRDIRSRPRGYGKTKALAEEFGVHVATITNIIKHHSWPDA